MHSFPVQPSFAEETEECLPKVLTCKEPAIMKVIRHAVLSFVPYVICTVELHIFCFCLFQFLALQDLALLSQHSAVRRMEVFSLSQPGV